MLTNLNSTEISEINKESDSKRFGDASLFLEKTVINDKDENCNYYH